MKQSEHIYLVSAVSVGLKSLRLYAHAYHRDLFAVNVRMRDSSKDVHKFLIVYCTVRPGEYPWVKELPKK
jgi:hypothetical protein